MDKLKKFHVDYCDLPTMLDNVDTLLRIVNVKINKNNDGRINIVPLTLWIISFVCFNYVYIFSALWFVFVYCRRTGDLIAASVVFSLAVCSQPSFLQMCYMICFKKRVQRLIQRYLDLNDLIKPGSTFSKNLHVQLRKVKRRASIVWMMVVTNGTLYVMIPVFLPGRHLTEDLQVLYGLEPMFESPNFEIATTTMALSVYLCAFSLANLTAFNIVVLGYSESQMITLGLELPLLWTDADDYYNSIQKSVLLYKSGSKRTITNAYIKDRLKEIIHIHIQNINLIREFENVFRITKAIEFFFLILAMISELLGGIENTYLELPFSFVLIFMECSSGQKLMDASEMFERAIYDCDWERFDNNNMRTVLIMLTCAQRTLCVSAGGLTTMNFGCLLSFMKFSYSTYNTLRLRVH